ncbi:flagellar biosynthesis, cell-distal portion of basal-body rod [Klebsiella pneumoniae]|nr:flagellar biosynthesis, cell-distal portion of basal-body rod [Klebsiella pneumoniae]
MPDVWDNNATIDEFVNSPELTLITRTGTERDTLAGIQKKSDDQRVQMAEDGAAVVEETRQNLIPLSRQYMTLEAAQNDIVNIPEGSTTYYRSPDDSALAIEVMNVGGTLQPTGRKMPSQAAIQAVLDYISSLIATDDADSPLLTLNDEAGFRLAAFGLNAIQSNAMTAEYDEFIDGFVFRDSVGFVIQQIGTPLLSSVDSVQPVVEQQRLVTEAFSAEFDADISGFVFRDSVGFVLMNLNGEQSDQNNDGVDDISRRNAANLAAAAAARDEINTRIARPVYDYNISDHRRPVAE